MAGFEKLFSEEEKNSALSGLFKKYYEVESEVHQVSDLNYHKNNFLAFIDQGDYEDSKFINLNRKIETNDFNEKLKNKVVQKVGHNYHVKDRTDIFLWLIDLSGQISKGDIIEFGTGNAWNIRSFLYSGKVDPAKKIYLCDRFSPFKVDNFSGKILDEESPVYATSKDVLDDLVQEFNNINLIEGEIPESLKIIDSRKFGFVHVDLNSALAEIAALDWVFSRLDSNFIILLDDFSSIDHEPQKEMLHEFFQNKSLRIQCLPTGQGVVLQINSGNLSSAL
jgi:hypothetical protein